MADSSIGGYEEREHLTFADVEKLSKSYTNETEFKDRVKCYRVVGNDYAPDSETGAGKSYGESFEEVFADMKQRHNKITRDSPRLGSVSFSIIYEDLNREGSDIGGKNIKQHFFLIMQVSDKFYILDSSGRGDCDNEKIMFDILCNGFKVPPQNIYSNSAQLQTDEFNCGSYAVEVMCRMMNIYRECVDPEVFNKRLAVYFDDGHQSNLGIHKSCIIGETKENKILYAIPPELFDLVESESYLTAMKEHFENEKQEHFKGIEEYKGLFNHYKEQGYIDSKKPTEELCVIEKPRDKPKLTEEQKTELTKILEKINKIRQRVLSIKESFNKLETVLKDINTLRQGLTPAEQRDPKNPKRHLISKVRTDHLNRLQNKKTQDNFLPLHY